MSDEERHEPDEILVNVRWQRRQMAVPLRQLEGVRLGPQSGQAIADWHYWCSRGYLF
jgi:Calcium binding